MMSCESNLSSNMPSDEIKQLRYLVGQMPGPVRESNESNTGPNAQKKLCVSL